jgi:hypothetical protein
MIHIKVQALQWIAICPTGAPRSYNSFVEEEFANPDFAGCRPVVH